jgi:hypothetical protein
MAVVRFNISTSRNLPKGSRVFNAKKMAAINGRLRDAMQPFIRADQKKKRKSLEIAARTVLNA